MSSVIDWGNSRNPAGSGSTNVAVQGDSDEEQVVPMAPANEPNPDSTSARTLAALYRRCGPDGEGPFALDYLLRVLVALGKLSHPTPLRPHAPVLATEVGRVAEVPALAVYGCVLELEEYGLARWVPQPVLRADHITAEITEDGVRFLRDIDVGSTEAAGSSE